MEIWVKNHLLDVDEEKLKIGIVVSDGIELMRYDNGSGYKFISINCNKEYIHRLMAIAFLPNPENKSQVNHINGIKSCNLIENLEWCTASENGKHAYKNNLNRISDYQKEQTSKAVSGTKCHFSILNENDVRDIRTIKKIGLTNKKIAELFNVNRETIGNIIRGKTWKRTI